MDSQKHRLTRESGYDDVICVFLRKQRNRIDCFVEDKELRSVKRFLLTVAARFRNFFTADIPGDAENLAGPDMAGIADLVPVSPVKERP